MRFGVVRGVGAEKAIESLLQQVVRQLTVAGHPREICPYSARGPLVERTECVLVHYEVRAGVLDSVGPIANR